MMILSYFFPNDIGWVILFVCIAGIIVLTITVSWIIKTRLKILKIKNKIVNSLDFYQYYSLALKELSNDKYQLSSLLDFFDVTPINFLPENGVSRTDEVLNFSCNGINYCYGTITNETITMITSGKGSQVVKPFYTRYCFLNIDLKQSTNLNAIIQPSKSFLKIFKTPNNTVLESIKFEKIYSVEADDQIMIRKISKPTVIENLTKLACNHESRPKISILNQEINFAFESFEVSGWNDPEGRIKGFNFKGKAVNMNIVESICKKIKFDLGFLLCTLNWAEGFDFFKNVKN